MRTTGRPRHGRHSRLIRLTAGGAFLAIVPMLSWACSATSSSVPPAVQQACSDYGDTARPMVAIVLDMDAKLKAGDTQGATEDANTIQSTLGGRPSQPPLTANDATADQLAFVVKVYSVWNSEWTWSRSVLSGAVGASDVEGFEAVLIGDAYLADGYATGANGDAVCPSLSIPSPYHP